MINAMTVSVDYLSKAVHELVEANIDDNLEALDANVQAAGEKAADELKTTSAPKNAWRGTSSISDVEGEYRAAWRAYRYRQPLKYKKALCVVANWHYPTLTHLLEFGHEYWYFGVHVGGRIDGNKAIEKAYNNAAPIAKGGKVT